MRRKLKFKEKEKRKEVRQIHRELREEFGMGPSRKDVRYLMEHDPTFTGKGQLAEALGETGTQKPAQTIEEPTGPSNQEISMQMWDHMEQNYERVQRGESANFNYNPYLPVPPLEHRPLRPQQQQFKAQPYQKKQVASGQVISSQPVLYNKSQAPAPEKSLEPAQNK